MIELSRFGIHAVLLYDFLVYFSALKDFLQYRIRDEVVNFFTLNWSFIGSKSSMPKNNEWQ